LTTDNVERIEVVRGPASVVYGSDAMTGVVQIFTRDGRGAPHGSIGLVGGTYGSDALDATLGGGSARAGYSLGMSRFSSNGLYPFNNAYRNQVVSGRLRLRPGQGSDVALSLRYGDALYHFPTDAIGDTVSNNQHQLDRGPSVGLDLAHAFSARVEGRVTADWHRDNYQRFGRYATYRAGVSVRIGAGARAIASVGTGFKEPGFYENFATGFVRGNPDLTPEHSHNWEAGLEYAMPGRTVTARATYFH